MSVRRPDTTELPVIIIGGGPVGLAAAVHLRSRGLPVLILEAGDEAGAAVRKWGHIQLFSPWRFNIDPVAADLLNSSGWAAPEPDTLPTGHELVDDYLKPLAAALGGVLRTRSPVVEVTREGLGKTRTHGRETHPFRVRVRRLDGTYQDLRARSVIDASGSFGQPNPVGAAGTTASGELAARAKGVVTSPLPQIDGAQRSQFARRHVLVVGAGHSAAHALLGLAELTRTDPQTRISWAVRADRLPHVYEEASRDALPARGALNSQLRSLVEAKVIAVRSPWLITELESSGKRLLVTAEGDQGTEQLTVDTLIPATGFRPDLSILNELQLDLDPALESPRKLGPMIDPELHSCGTVPPHGASVLAHPEKDFYIVGMKSYGRAPTFLMATGYEQVRSVAAALAGDHRAADAVNLRLPETGVCTADRSAA